MSLKIFAVTDSGTDFRNKRVSPGFHRSAFLSQKPIITVADRLTIISNFVKRLYA